MTVVCRDGDTRCTEVPAGGGDVQPKAPRARPARLPWPPGSGAGVGGAGGGAQERATLCRTFEVTLSTLSIPPIVFSQGWAGLLDQIWEF